MIQYLAIILIFGYLIIFAYEKGKEKATVDFLNAANEIEFNNYSEPETIQELAKILLKYI